MPPPQVLCLPPVTPRRMRGAVLGSMPGAASLAAQQYYAHPRNNFWPLMRDLLAIEPALPYARRCRALRAAGIGLWDVLAACERSGSLDQAIDRSSAVLNDLATWLASPQLRVLALNGQLAGSLFRSRTDPELRAGLEQRGVAILVLPSTSPANARDSYASKRRRWNQLAQALRAS